MMRLSCAIEENGLLAMGQDNTERLFVASSYFANLRTHANDRFKESYYQLHGDRAPMLNAIGQSMYEGVHFLARLWHYLPDDMPHWPIKLKNGLRYRSARNAVYYHNHHKDQAIYLAEAQGHSFLPPRCIG